MSGWFPRVNAQGRIVSGAGALFLDGQPLGEVGWNPVWFTKDTFIYNAAERGLRLYDVQAHKSVQLDPRELIELAAGGGVWAGRHAPSNALIVSSGGEIPGAGQPCLSSRGELIYRVGDDKIEPSICLTAAAWGDGRGRIIAHTGQDVTVGPFEARPVLIDTPGGAAWVLCMTRTGLHLRPLFSDVGYWLNTGEDHNINAHAIYIGGNVIKCVWQDTQGHLYDRDVDLLTDASVPLPVSSGPIVLPDPEEPPVADMPESLEEAVISERAKYPMPLVSVNDYARILNAVAWTHRDKGWGLSEKPQGNHVMSPQGKWVAYDILHHQPSNTLWGCFGDAGVNWGLEQYHNDPDGRPWLAPIAPTGGDNGDPGDEDDGDTAPDKPPVSCNCAADLKQLRAALAELEQVMVDAAKAANDRFVKLETAPEKPLPELVARGKVYGLKIELPVVPK